MSREKPLKVFHGPLNYGTQAGILARGLRELGVHSFSYTGNDPFNRLTDYQFKQRKGILAKLVFYKVVYPLIKLSCFFSYNIFHFYFGKTLHKRQWDLPFYKFFGKKVIMHYLGNDIELYRWSVENYSITNMQHLFSPDSGQKHDEKILKRRGFEKRYLDKEYVCAPQYAPFNRKAEILPLAFDLSSVPLSKPLNWNKGDELKVLHAPTSRKKKGTEFLIRAVDRLQNEGYKIELEIIEGVKHSELLKRYENCHLSVNALLGGWYGTAGIEAMAVGRPLVTFIRPEFLKLMKTPSEKFPIISANKDSIYFVLLSILQGKISLKGRGMACRKYVEDVHDYRELSRKLLADYRKLL